MIIPYDSAGAYSIELQVRSARVDTVLECTRLICALVQQCVHLLSTATQQLCVHYLPNTAALKDSARWNKYFPPDLSLIHI